MKLLSIAAVLLLSTLYGFSSGPIMTGTVLISQVNLNGENCYVLKISSRGFLDTFDTICTESLSHVGNYGGNFQPDQLAFTTSDGVYIYDYFFDYYESQIIFNSFHPEYANFEIFGDYGYFILIDPIHPEQLILTAYDLTPIDTFSLNTNNLEHINVSNSKLNYVLYDSDSNQLQQIEHNRSNNTSDTIFTLNNVDASLFHSGYSGVYNSLGQTISYEISTNNTAEFDTLTETFEQVFPDISGYFLVNDNMVYSYSFGSPSYKIKSINSSITAIYTIDSEKYIYHMRGDSLLLSTYGNTATEVYLGHPDSVSTEHYQFLLTATSNTHELETKIFPNPTSGSLQIQSDENFKSFRIINIFGQVMMVGDLSSKTIELSELEAGQFILELVHDSNKRTTSFIKY